MTWRSIRDTFVVTACEASAAELDRYRSALTAIWSAYQALFDRGGRRSVFILERAGAS